MVPCSVLPYPTLHASSRATTRDGLTGVCRYCKAGETEYQVVGPTKTEEMEAQYTDCHTHGSET